MRPYSMPRRCWNCDRTSRNVVTVPLEPVSGGRFELTLCHECFRSCFAPLLIGGSPRRRASEPQPTVLVVDDDPGVRRFLMLALECEGFNVDMAANGQEALTRIGEGPPQAIVLDLHMPVMNGQDFLRVLRRSSRAHSIPVLAISAYNADVTASDLGVDAFLAKPLQLRALIGTVTDLIAKSA